MLPDENRPTTPIVVPQRQSTADDNNAPNNDAAANVVRGQIDAIFGGSSTTEPAPHPTTTAPPAETTPEPVLRAPATPEPRAASPHLRGPIAYTPGADQNVQYAHQQAEVVSPYQRNHTPTSQQLDNQPNNWQKYHTAWQSYYQQYYSRYYEGKTYEDQQAVGKKESDESTITPDEALYDLRAKLRNQIQTKATTVRKSRHFMPAMAAIAVMIVFLFLQYNRVIFANIEAYVTPGDLDPSALIIDPSITAAVSADPRLIVPKINVDVPIVWDAVASDQNSLNNAMNNGVAWFNIPGANARPGEVGNFVVSGHSSNDWLDNGNYKFIFARLEQIQVGDVVYANYNGTRYTYTITKKIVVKPTDVHALTDPTEKPIITLITCVPLGTALNRLLVFGEQISPDPSSAAKNTTAAPTTEPAKMPSNSPTFFQRIFGWGG
ncbi:MAG: sortase [Candidatus Saccharimonas sp.]